VQQRSINLTFHGIGEPGRDLEPGEDDVWVTHGAFHAILDSVAGRDDVRITFDDGNASDLEHALPALRHRGLNATFFVVAGRIGQPGFLDDSAIRTLAGAGMTIGCHGMRHRPWRALDDGELRREHIDARRLLEEIVERPVDQAACPFGSYDRRVLHSLRRARYRTVYTSDRGTTPARGWIQPRNTVAPGDDERLLARIVAAEGRRSDTLRRRAKRAVKRWR
jgi:peptidoglycan/xylan/chitin deacetylase (PgdA/CDA1 family)